jgi:hypothetical protein
MIAPTRRSPAWACSAERGAGKLNR